MAVSARSRVPRTPSEAFRASVAFFEHSLDAALFTAPDGRILHANDAASELLGMTKDEICRLGRAGLADPADDRWAAGVAERARTGRFFGPLSFRRGDGTLVELVVSSKVFTDADGEPRTVIVMRPLTSDRGLDEALNVAVVDPSGIPNRPAFVQLAEMQRHKAVRERVGLGLVYARLNIPAAIANTERSSDTTRASFAALFAEECGWGDVVGRVGENDFAMLIGDGDADAALVVVRSLFARLHSHPPQLSIHIGVLPIEPGSTIGVLELLDQAAASMDAHERQAHASPPPLCFFSLNEPRAVRPLGPVPGAEDLALTPRELTVLRLLALGSSYKELSAALFISINTVKSHVSHIYTKLGVTDRKEARAVARNLGLLPRAAPAGIASQPRPPVAELTSPAQRSAQATSPREKGGGRQRTSEPEEADFNEQLGLVARDLTYADDADDVLDIIISRGLLGVKADAAIIAGIEHDALVPLATRGYSHDAVAAFFPAPLELELPLTVSARENTAVWISNRADAMRSFPELGTSPVARSNAWMAMPLAAGGVIFGALGISFLEPHEFTPQERRYLRTVADLCALALRLGSSTNDHPTTQDPTSSK